MTRGCVATDAVSIDVAVSNCCASGVEEDAITMQVIGVLWVSSKLCCISVESDYEDDESFPLRMKQ